MIQAPPAPKIPIMVWLPELPVPSDLIKSYPSFQNLLHLLTATEGNSCHPVKWCMRLLCAPTMPLLGFPDGVTGQEPACQCRRPKRHGLNPWVRKIPWRRDGSPLQYSCLENPRDRGAWWVHRLTQSQTQLKWLNTHTQCLFQLFIL